MYAFNNQQPPPAQAAFVGQPGMAMNQSQQYLTPSFDGLPRAVFESHPTPVFRQGNVGHSSVQTASYQGYLHADSRSNHGSGIKLENLPRTH
jgi:hypothetical protein